MIIIKQIITENSEILFIVLSLSLSLVLIFPFLFSGSFFLFLHLYLLQFNLSQISSLTTPTLGNTPRPLKISVCGRDCGP